MPYVDGLPAASSVSFLDLIEVCQGGTPGRPGTGTSRRASLGQLLGSSSGGAFLPLIGGNVTGPIGVGGLLSSNQTFAAGAGEMTQLAITTNIHGVGSAANFKSAQKFITNISESPRDNYWAAYDEINYRGTGQPDPVGPPSYVSRYMSNLVWNDQGGTPTSAQSWAAISSIVDFTGHRSSQAGVLLVHEFDLACCGPDDYVQTSGRIGGRKMAGFYGGIGQNTYSGTDTQIAVGVEIAATSNPDVFSFIDMLSINGGFTSSAIDLHTAIPVGGSATALWVGANNTIGFDNQKYMRLGWKQSDLKLELSWTGTPIVTVNPSGTINILGEYQFNGTRVVGPRKPGWGTATGEVRSSFNATTASLGATAGAVAALITDLRAHGLIGD